MSEKKRRDITLGEMQDECLKHKMCEGCPYAEWCGANSADGWDLTDPPRFSEEQMAVFNGLYEMGARRIDFQATVFMMWKSMNGLPTGFMGTMVSEAFGMANLKFETLDLAELLGKDAT